MQPIAKNKANKGGGDFIPWHPNFRNTVELPDTKTVRTRFFVNAACVVLALCAALYYAYNEYQLGQAKEELESWEQRIAADTKGSAEAVALYKTFKAEEAKATEFTKFVSGEKLVLSDFVLAIGDTLPPNVVITGIQYGQAEVVLRGSVQGAAEQASGVASAYEKQLKENPVFSALFQSIALANLAREASAGALTFEIAMKFKK